MRGTLSLLLSRIFFCMGVRNLFFVPFRPSFLINHIILIMCVCGVLDRMLFILHRNSVQLMPTQQPKSGLWKYQMREKFKFRNK